MAREICLVYLMMIAFSVGEVALDAKTSASLHLEEKTPVTGKLGRLPKSVEGDLAIGSRKTKTTLSNRSTPLILKPTPTSEDVTTKDATKWNDSGNSSDFLNHTNSELKTVTRTTKTTTTTETTETMTITKTITTIVITTTISKPRTQNDTSFIHNTTTRDGIDPTTGTPLDGIEQNATKCHEELNKLSITNIPSEYEKLERKLLVILIPIIVVIIAVLFCFFIARCVKPAAKDSTFLNIRPLPTIQHSASQESINNLVGGEQQVWTDSSVENNEDAKGTIMFQGKGRSVSFNKFIGWNECMPIRYSCDISTRDSSYSERPLSIISDMVYLKEPYLVTTDSSDFNTFKGM